MGSISGQVTGTDGLPLPSITGRITGKVADALGNPIAGAGIQIMAAPDQNTRWNLTRLYASTDTDGQYQIDPVPNGSYVAHCSVQNGWDYIQLWWPDAAAMETAKIIIISDETPGWQADFTLRIHPIYGAIVGTVSDENGQGIAGAAVCLLDNTGPPVTWATTDENGRFEIMGVANGPYYLQAGKLGYATTFNGNTSNREATTPLIAANGQTEVNIILPPARSTDVDVKVLPDKVELLGNYPNPFNPKTSIHFPLPSPLLARACSVESRIVILVGSMNNSCIPSHFFLLLL